MSQDELGQMLGHGKLYIGYIIEIRETNDLNLVELRGFEPLTSAARVPVLQGLIAKARRRTAACFRHAMFPTSPAIGPS